MQSDISLYTPLIEAISQRTALLVAEILQQQTPTPRVRRYGNMKEAASYLGWSKTALAQKKSAGLVPHYCFKKIRNTYRWDFNALDRWMQERNDED